MEPATFRFAAQCLNQSATASPKVLGVAEVIRNVRVKGTR